MIDVVSTSCYGRAFVSVWYKYVNREVVGWGLWVSLGINYRLY